jgi:hypothetical protein
MRNNNTIKGLIIALVLSVAAAGFFGYRSYSMDHMLNIPPIDHAMGHDEPSPVKSPTKAKTNNNSNKNNGNNRNGGGGGFGGPMR